MNTSKYRFTLDMQSEISQMSLPVRQWDNNRELLINLTDSGTPYIIERGCYAYFAATNSQGEEIILPCTIVKNTTINIVMGNVITKVPGVVDCEIRLYGANNELITSPRFILVVQSRVLSDDSDSVKEEDLPLLNQLMGEEAKRVTAEEKRESAEEARQQRFNTAMETYGEKIAQTITSAQIADGLAQSALNSANDAVTRANVASSMAESAANTAEQAAATVVSPTVSVSAISNGHRVTITDKSGTRYFDVMDGKSYTYGSTDLVAGSSALATGMLHLVYE